MDAHRRHRRPRRRAGHRGRGAGHRRRYRRPAGRQHRARAAASRSFPARTSARSATPGWSRPTTTRLRRARCGCCAAMARSRSTSIALVGGNFRLDALQAAVLRVKAPHLAGWTEAGARNADRYRALFARGGSGRPRDAAGRVAGTAVTSTTSSSCACRIATASRRCSPIAQVGTAIYYPVPFHLQECFAALGYARRRVSARRGGRPRDAGAADLRRAHRGAAARCRRRRWPPRSTRPPR